MILSRKAFVKLAKSDLDLQGASLYCARSLEGGFGLGFFVGVFRVWFLGGLVLVFFFL